ncbi:MAG: DUF4258 domain-containing protein [Candidatus Aenigmarchaeota archaeon]|nr:DUF4258 domain-containing protein [Candidatus Aenigmarchaeota archaeon]
MKRIIFSGHANDRRKARGISFAEIEATINYPDYLKTGQTGRKVAVKDVRGRSITVVFAEEESYLIVITVY